MGDVGKVLLLGLMFLAATIIIEIPVMIIAGNAARVLVTMVLTLFFVPFSAIYHYVIFENLRALKPRARRGADEKGDGIHQDECDRGDRSSRTCRMCAHYRAGIRGVL